MLRTFKGKEALLDKLYDVFFIVFAVAAFIAVANANVTSNTDLIPTVTNGVTASTAIIVAINGLTITFAYTSEVKRDKAMITRTYYSFAFILVEAMLHFPNILSLNVWKQRPRYSHRHDWFNNRVGKFRRFLSICAQKICGTCGYLVRIQKRSLSKAWNNVSGGKRAKEIILKVCGRQGVTIGMSENTISKEKLGIFDARAVSQVLGKNVLPIDKLQRAISARTAPSHLSSSEPFFEHVYFF